MSGILDQLTQRITGANKQKQTEQSGIVEEIRDEIGRQHAQEAERVLPTLERTIATDFRPWMVQLTTIMTHTTTPLPFGVKQWFTEMEQLATNHPQQVRQGLAAYQGLTFQQLVSKDGHTVDQYKHADIVHGIRQLLRSHDGVLSRMKSLKGQIEYTLNETGWPNGSPPCTMTTEPGREQPSVQVET